MNIESTTGFIHENAFLKIDEYSCDQNNNIRARVRAYISREHALAGASHIEGSEEIIEIKGDYSERALNTKIQIYDYLGTLDKYKDAIDVPE